jgi:hypothetical protein
MTSIPLVRPPVTTTAALADYGFVAQLFKMECRRPPSEGVDYCPALTPARPQVGFDPYQFTMQTLIGFIYHAQMYTGQLVTDCSGPGLTPKTVTAGSYAAHSTGGGADPTRFIVDQLAAYTCRSGNVSDPTKETRMISAVADGSYQATLHTRYGYVANGPPQTDFFQVDVVMNAGSPEFLALNFASGAPWRSRIVLLANLVNHKFAVKVYVPAQPDTQSQMTAPERYATAVGVGGWDLASGTPNPGYYYIDFKDDPGVFQRCVDNATGEFQPDFTACTSAGVPVPPGGWASSDAIKTYLSVPAAHEARLAPFLAMFSAAATLGPTQAWQAAGDEDLYWPATLN